MLADQCRKEVILFLVPAHDVSPLMFRLPVPWLRSTASGTTPAAAAALPLAVCLTRTPDAALARDPDAVLARDHSEPYGCLTGPAAVSAAVSAVSTAVATSAFAIHTFCTPKPVFAFGAPKPVFAQRSAMALAATLAAPQCLTTAAVAAAIALFNASKSLIAAAIYQIIVRLVAGALPARSLGTRLPLISRAAGSLGDFRRLLSGRIGPLAVHPNPTGTAHAVPAFLASLTSPAPAALLGSRRQRNRHAPRHSRRCNHPLCVHLSFSFPVSRLVAVSSGIATETGNGDIYFHKRAPTSIPSLACRAPMPADSRRKKGNCSFKRPPIAGPGPIPGRISRCAAGQG
jgi:hypothetical protein